MTEEIVADSKEIQSPNFLRACLCQHILLGDTHVAEAAAAITPHYKAPCFLYFMSALKKLARSINNVASELKLPDDAVLCTQRKNRSL